MTESPARPGYRFFLACLEFAWMYPLWVLSLSLFPGFAPPGPGTALAILGLTCAATGLLKGRGLRRIVLVFIEAAVLLADILISLSGRYGTFPAVPAPTTTMVALELAFVTGWAVWAWYKGVKLMRAPVSLAAAGTAFDVGTGMLLSLALLGWGLHLPVSGLEKYAVLLFMAGMGAMAAANRGDDDIKPRGGPGGQSRGPAPSLFLAGFAGIACALCTAIWILGRSTLERAARVGMGGLGKILSLALSFIANILRAMMGMRQRATDATDGADLSFGKTVGVAGGGGQHPVLNFVLLWGLRLAIAGIIALIAANFAPPFLKWLMGRSGGGASGKGLKAWIARLRGLMLRFSEWLADMTGVTIGRRVGSGSQAVRVYRRLVRWGRVSGQGPLKCETPLEFGRRIATLFPEISEAASLTAERFCAEYYGAKPPSSDACRRPSPEAAYRRLSAPRTRLCLLLLGRIWRRTFRGAGTPGSDAITR